MIKRVRAASVLTSAVLSVCSGFAQAQDASSPASIEPEATSNESLDAVPHSVAGVPDSTSERTGHAYVHPQKKSPGKWLISAGFTLRRIGSMRYGGGCHSSSHPIPAMSSSGSSGRDSVGGRGGYADREYRDGYVHTDEWTEFDGGTSVWGYDSSSQVRDGYISFHGVSRVEREFSRTRTVSSLEWSKDSDREYGWAINARRAVFGAGRFDAGLNLSVSRANFSASGAGSSFRDSQRWRSWNVDVTDTYSLEGTGISENSAPVQWTPANPGPAIDNAPATRSETRRLVSSGAYDAYNSVAQSLDLSLSTLSLGVAIGARWRRLVLSGAVGPTLNLAETEAAYRETLYASLNGSEPNVLNRWNEFDNNSNWLLGLFLEAGLALDVTDRLQTGFFGRYDWLETIDGRTGPASYTINPEGGSIGATMGLSF